MEIALGVLKSISTAKEIYQIGEKLKNLDLQKAAAKLEVVARSPPIAFRVANPIPYLGFWENLCAASPVQSADLRRPAYTADVLRTTIMVSARPPSCRRPWRRHESAP